MTTEYFRIEPRELGTLDSESFGSLLCRMAVAHSVSFYVLLKHVDEWWRRERGESLPATNGTRFFFAPAGRSIEKFAYAISVGMDCETVARTFLPCLGDFISPNLNGLAKRHRSWCPACFTERGNSDSLPHERLLWMLSPIVRCVVHRIRLEDRCPLCGCAQTAYHASGNVSLCYRCSGSLVSDSSGWQFCLTPGFGEVDCVDLVTSWSAGELKPVPNAFGRYAREMRKIVPKGPQRLQIGSCVFDAEKRALDLRPKLSTVLKECASTGVSITYLMEEPEQAARSTGLLELARIAFEPVKSRRVAKESYATADIELERELSKPDVFEIPSIHGISKKLGIPWPSLVKHLPGTTKRYRLRRLRWVAENKASEQLVAAAELSSGLLKKYLSGELRSQDHVVEEVRRRTGVGTSVARKALDEALHCLQPHLPPKCRFRVHWTSAECGDRRATDSRSRQTREP